MTDLIKQKILEYYRPRRVAFSSRHPRFLKPTIFVRRKIRGAKNLVTIGRRLKPGPALPSVLARHSSLLYRRLGDTDQKLQVNKIHNLQLAISKINGLVIPPGKIFSLWHQLGLADKKSGYLDGLILSGGEPKVGVGGGLCQLSNFLFWIFLHTDIEVIERYHHSVDAFPDSGRTLPFGSGATIFHNFVDLQIKNISQHPLQIKLWLTDKCLKGQVLSDSPAVKKFHLQEKNHFFVYSQGQYFRYNEIHRITYIGGKKVREEEIVKNFAPVKYKVTKEYLRENGYEIIKI